MGNVASEYLKIGGFPSVAGCVDGTLIPIELPPENEQQYVDRYGNHSLNVMMISGPDYYSFYYVNARWPGSVHDARVLRASQISTKYENGYRPFPGAVPLGDSGYPLQEWLMTLYRHNALDPAEEKYNRRHKCTRRIVECTYGILKNRSPCLKLLKIHPIRVAKTVIVCAVLHNIASADDFYKDPPDNPEEVDVGQERHHGGVERVKDFLNYFR